MKRKILAGLLTLLTSSVVASASITLNTAFGTAYSASGAVIPDGTLWALVVDTNGDSSFMGQFGLNQSLSASAANSLFTTGSSIALGSILGGDTVFALGGFNADGSSFDVVLANLGTYGLAQGLNFAFVWFPGVTYTTAGATYQVGTEVGAIHSNVDATTVGNMVIPADGALVPVGAGTPDGAGGTLTAAQFTAVQLVPEPSVALLGALGALGLLRRKRA